MVIISEEVVASAEKLAKSHYVGVPAPELLADAERVGLALLRVVEDQKRELARRAVLVTPDALCGAGFELVTSFPLVYRNNSVYVLFQAPYWCARLEDIDGFVARLATQTMGSVYDLLNAVYDDRDPVAEAAGL